MYHSYTINTQLTLISLNSDYINYIMLIILYYFMHYINSDLKNILICLDITFYVWKK